MYRRNRIKKEQSKNENGNKDAETETETAKADEERGRNLAEYDNGIHKCVNSAQQHEQNARKNHL